MKKSFRLLAVFLLVTSVVAGIDSIVDEADVVLIWLYLLQFILATVLLYSCSRFDGSNKRSLRLLEMSCWLGVCYALTAGGTIIALSYPQFGYISINIVVISLVLAGVVSMPFILGISKIKLIRKK